MQKIEIPAATNQRADEMWAIIKHQADLKGKTVTDLGCGHGDMLWRALGAGAKSVLGIDRDSDLCQSLTEASAGADGFSVMQGNLNYLGYYYTGGDILFCFSVLPYLLDPNSVLRWIRAYSGMAFLEVQYAGDGPGFTHIHNDDDMRRWLRRIGWQNIEAIGRTHTKIRPAWRTIWKCT